MRIKAPLETRPIAVFGVLTAVIALAVAGLKGQWGETRALTAHEMSSAVGLQVADYACMPAPGCNGYPTPNCSNQCRYCVNWTGSSGVCGPAPGQTCTSSSWNCGNLVQGVCNECDGTCDMSSPTVVGSCGTIGQCQ